MKNRQERTAGVKPVGDQAVLVSFGSVISEETGARAAAFAGRLRKESDWVTETVPAYASCLVYYDARQLSYEEAAGRLLRLADEAAKEKSASLRTVSVPVLYGGEEGPDLSFVAAHAGISEEEVIRRHTAPSYRIYMLGFTPGFPYLGGLDPLLETPRLKTPRVRIPAGSVGIAGQQTGIYPTASPGGWQLIGRTPLKLFDAAAEPPALLAAGMRLRFRAVGRAEYEAIGRAVKAGEYVPQTEEEAGL